MFSIVGLQKLKTRGQIARRASHYLRAHVVLNADPTRARLNATSWRGAARSLADAIWTRTTPAAQRKDSVRALELLLTASPEWFHGEAAGEKIKALLKGAKAFLAETFGLDNVAAWGIHRDEQTPHVWALVTPIKDGKLRASHWVDGPKKLADMHTRWANHMAPHGLRRGAHKSKATHIDVRTYYGAVNGDATAQETINREMSRRAARAERRAEESEARAAEAEERDKRSRALLSALDAEAREVVRTRLAAQFRSKMHKSASPT